MPRTAKLLQGKKTRRGVRCLLPNAPTLQLQSECPRHAATVHAGVLRETLPQMLETEARGAAVMAILGLKRRYTGATYMMSHHVGGQMQDNRERVRGHNLHQLPAKREE